MVDSVKRNRELDLTYTQAGSRVLSYGPNCTSSTLAFTGSRVGVYKSMEDYVTPNFRELQRRGAIINSPMSRTTNTFTATPSGVISTYSKSGWNCTTGVGTWKYQSSNYLAFKLGPLPLMGSVMTLAYDNLIADVSTRTRAAVKSPSVQGLVFLAEAQQTLNLLKNPLQAITSLLKRARHNRRVEYPPPSLEMEIANSASSQYLSVVFGILPLMHDIEGLVEALAKHVQERETARATANDSTQTTTSNIVLYSSPTGSLTSVKYGTTVKEEVIVRAGSLYAFSGHTVAGGLGMSLKDIPSSLWEHLPWSFVVDWFTNLGKLIEAITASCTNEFLAEWLTIHQKRTVTRFVTESTADTANGWNITTNCTDTDSAVYETYSRSPANLGLHMGLVLNMSLSRMPILTSLSLLMQQLYKAR